MKKIIGFTLIILILFTSVVCADALDDVWDDTAKDNINNAFESANLEINAVDLIDKLTSGNFDYKYTDFIDYIKIAIKKEASDNGFYFQCLKPFLYDYSILRMRSNCGSA